MMYRSSPCVMALFGHSGSQAPQLMHSSVIFRAISSSSRFAGGGGGSGGLMHRRLPRRQPRAREIIREITDLSYRYCPASRSVRPRIARLGPQVLPVLVDLRGDPGEGARRAGTEGRGHDGEGAEEPVAARGGEVEGEGAAAVERELLPLGVLAPERLDERHARGFSGGG